MYKSLTWRSQKCLASCYTIMLWELHVSYNILANRFYKESNNMNLVSFYKYAHFQFNRIVRCIDCFESVNNGFKHVFEFKLKKHNDLA